MCSDHQLWNCAGGSGFKAGWGKEDQLFIRYNPWPWAAQFRGKAWASVQALQMGLSPVLEHTFPRASKNHSRLAKGHLKMPGPNPWYLLSCNEQGSLQTWLGSWHAEIVLQYPGGPGQSDHKPPHKRKTEMWHTHTEGNVLWRQRQSLQWCSHKPKNARSYQKLGKVKEGILP